MKNTTKQCVLLAVTVSLFFAGPLLIFAAEKARVTTYGVRNVTMTSANLRGFVSDDGGCAKMTNWFEYGTTREYGQKTSTISHRGVGYFNDDVYDLTPCTTYHFRAVAKNNTKITSYGSDMVFKTQCASFEVNTSVKNLTRGDDVWYRSMNADPGDELLYKIKVASTGDILIQNLMLASDLPSGISYEGGLKIDDRRSQYNISVGSVSLGNLFPEQTKVLTFAAKVGEESQLNYGRNELVHSAVAYSDDYSNTGTCKVYVTRPGVAGAATVAPPPSTPPPTQLPTGITNGVFGSVLLPLALALLLVWLFRSPLVGLEQWAQERRVRADQFRAKRKLNRTLGRSQGRSHSGREWQKLK